MAITYLGSSTSSSTNGGDVTVNLSSISGLAENDLVIVVGACGDNDNVDFTEAMVTSGYTKVADLFANDTQDTTMGVFWKVMGATPDSSAVYSGQGGTDSAVAAIAFGFRGVDTTTPMDVTPTTATGTDTNIVNPPSIDHNNPSGVWTVALGAFGHTSGNAVTCTASSGYSGSTSVSGNDTSDITVCGGYLDSPSDPEDPGVFTPSIGDSTSHSWCACTIALRPAASSTNIDCTVQSLTLTENVATVNAAKNISMGVVALTVATFAASVGLNINVQATSAALTVATHQATVTYDVNVSATSQSLTLTEYPFSQALNINANADALTLTTYTATVDTGAGSGLDSASKRGSAIHVQMPFRDIYPFPDGTVSQLDRQFIVNLYAGISSSSATNIDAGYAALSLTEYVATVNAAKNIQADISSLTLTAYAANVNASTNISASFDSLALTAYLANVNAATSIAASFDALTVTTYPATIQAGNDVFIGTNVHALTLTEYPAGVSVPEVVGPALSPGGVSRAMHWAPDRPVQYPKRKLTKREERELKTLVLKAIDYEDERAKKRLEALARKYADFENSLASFAVAFQSMSEVNRRRFEQHRISALAYQQVKEEIEDEETLIMHLIEYL